MKNVIEKVKKVLKYVFLLNHWGYGLPFPSWLYAIRRWIRHKDFFGYWTSYREWEESMKHAEYTKVRYKTISWLKTLI